LLEALFSTTVQEKTVILEQYRFHMRARNLAPRTIEAAGDYLKPFLALHDPFKTTRVDIEQYLAAMFERCRPSYCSQGHSWRCQKNGDHQPKNLF